MRKPVKEDAVKSETSGLAVGQRNYVGIIIRALTTKNRFVKQYLEGELYVSFANGTDKYHGLLDLAVGLGIIQQTGSTYSFEGEKIGYAKSFINDSVFWENKIIPLIDENIKTEWTYSKSQDLEIKKMESEIEKEEE
jgi:recombination protein RecA